MTDKQPAETPLDEETENEDSEDSPNETNETDDTQSPDGDNNQDDDKKPFHEHPRWKQRESEWNEKFNSQESRHQEDIKNLREEFAGARKANAEQDNIPSWFGGSQEQWDAYREHEDAKIKSAEERAFQRLNSAKTAEEKAIEDATTHMQTEMQSIESDKELNPNGTKIDPNKFLKFVIDNKFIDTENQKWDYRRAWKFYQLENNSGVSVNKDRKTIAGATTPDNKGEAKPISYKTSADFKKSKPW